MAVTRGRIGALDAYWPEAALKEPVKAWLRRDPRFSFPLIVADKP